MLIAGASGHALELLSILQANGYGEPIVFYDDIAVDSARITLGNYRVLHSAVEASEFFQTSPSFCIGVGNPKARKILASRLSEAGGTLSSVISRDAFIGKHMVHLGKGLNIMQQAVITANTSIGDGVLLHVHASVHHDTVIGDYCELSPGCRILGGATIGAYVSVGTNAVVMRNVTIGEHAVIGAGAVVTRDVSAGATVIGVPARSVTGK
jgi:sugar O-acyltransferase (sialic acid O-acetyltransferase NeuD family)